jgi:hypothetical protein
VSQENVTVVQEFEKLMSARESHLHTDDDYGPILAFLDPGIVVRVCESLPHGGRWVGHEGFMEMGDRIVDARKVVDFTVKYVDGGEHVIVIVSLTHEVDGKRFDPFRMVNVYTVENGLITGIDSYYEDTSPARFAA